MSISRPLCFFPLGRHALFDIPRWQQGQQPAQPLDRTAHQPGSQRSHSSGPSHRMQPPPWRPGHGPHHGCAVPGSSIQKQTGRGRGREPDSKYSREHGHRPACHAPALGVAPGPESPPALTWQVGKVSWCCSNWPTAKSRTLANLAWCRRNRVRSRESSSSCRCVDTSRKLAMAGARCYNYSPPGAGTALMGHR